MPARTCVGVAALIGGGRIEIDGLARSSDDGPVRRKAAIPGHNRK
jgi:hypothetical protein